MPCTVADQHPFFKTHLVQASENADHHHSTVPISFRRDFESPIAHLRQTDSDAEDERADLPDPDPTGPADALFIRELAANFGDLGINIHDANFNVPLRSWFLDHATIRQWFAPRIFHLQGPPQTWEDQIVAAWRDQLDDDEWFDVSVIQPSPPRPPHHSAVILDVVIAQSIHIHRYAGLVTVIPGSNMRFQMYSVAISFSPQISGNDIIRAADASPMCRFRRCTITHRWQEIPVSDHPVHGMSHGTSCHVTIHANPSQDDQRKKRRQFYTSAASSSSSALPDLHHAHADFSGAPANQASSASSSSAPPQQETPDCQCDFFHEEDVHAAQTVLHVFQLDGPTHTITLSASHGICVSHTVSQAIAVPLNQLEILHQVPIQTS